MALRDGTRNVYKLLNGQELTVKTEDFKMVDGVLTHILTFQKEKKGKYQATGNKPTGRPKGSKNKLKPALETKKIRLGVVQDPLVI